MGHHTMADDFFLLRRPKQTARREQEAARDSIRRRGQQLDKTILELDYLRTRLRRSRVIADHRTRLALNAGAEGSEPRREIPAAPVCLARRQRNGSREKCPRLFES